ncbi:MAG: transcriptional repressor [Chloroflexi bacterium]|nr:transcriptional repressor [Chloroflexota bacterium]
MAIYDVFLETNDHICAEHVLEAVHGMHPEWHMNKTTVYRTLDLLQSLGLIYEMRHDDGRAQYELALYGPHGHLICNVCGQVWDLDSRIAAALHQELRTKQGFIVDVENHALQGLCARCATA